MKTPFQIKIFNSIHVNRLTSLKSLPSSPSRSVKVLQLFLWTIDYYSPTAQVQWYDINLCCRLKLREQRRQLEEKESWLNNSWLFHPIQKPLGGLIVLLRPSESLEKWTGKSTVGLASLANNVQGCKYQWSWNNRGTFRWCSAAIEYSALFTYQFQLLQFVLTGVIFLDIIKYCDHPRRYEKMPSRGGMSDRRCPPLIGDLTSYWKSHVWLEADTSNWRSNLAIDKKDD